MAGREVVEECWPTLEAVASQVAMAVWNLRHRAGLERRVESLGSAADLVRELVRADTYRGAVRSTVGLCFELVDAPVAAWLGNGGEELSLLSVRGLGSRKRSELRGALPTLPRWGSLKERERARIASRFASIAEVGDAVAIDGGDALILAGGQPEEAGAHLEVVGSLFQDVLGHLGLLERAERRKERLDLGIALTAHEVKGPLLGAKAAIDSLLTTSGEPPAEQDLLRRSGRELAQLAGLIDALLRWTVGSAPLRRRGIDLVRQVRIAVESCQLGSGEERVKISAPDRLRARVDAKHFRTAVANVVRNALAYSPPSSKVDVLVESDDGKATVTVRDRGPGVPAAERESIFDPFSRGQAGRTMRSAGGLGLFIARRVLEAHGGGIRLEPSRTGATFRLEVPLEGGRNHARAHR